MSFNVIFIIITIISDVPRLQQMNDWEFYVNDKAV